MSSADAGRLCQLYGRRRPRIAYRKRDFIDYALMIGMTSAVIWATYGARSVMAGLGFVLCAFMVVTFPIRHGLELAVPAIAKRPQDLLFMLVYKLRNIKPFYLVGLGLLLLENYLIYLTPGLPHHVEWMRSGALALFYVQFIAITLFRTAILVSHLRKRRLVRDFLSQTAWKTALSSRPSITLEIVHAWATGLLSHMALVAPWFLVIRYCNFSLVFAPLAAAVSAIVYVQYMRSYSLWFYRDHWLGHNSEAEFLYLHGAHHDAIPSGLAGVSGNGHLEGFMRHTLGVPTAFYNPLVSFILYTWEIQLDIRNHQYIPGIWPRLPRWFHETAQHSTHHYGHLEPYSIGLKFGEPEPPPPGQKKKFSIFPESALNSVMLDEQISGFQWDNPRYRRFLELYDRYQPQ